MRIRVRNRTSEDWANAGPARGRVHAWDRERRTIDEQLAAAFPMRRVVTLPQVTVTIESLVNG